MTSDIQLFIGGDTLPQPGLLAAAHDAIVPEGAECVGGGEDGVTFERLVRTGKRMRYRPGMAVLHDMEPWRLHLRHAGALA